jgi:glycosyltransferase involved in cell wall biosynthesis
MRIAVVTTDNRDQMKSYDLPAPLFGPAPEALLQGLALLPEVEVHVIVCARAPMRCPEKVAPNMFFHCLIVPKIGWIRTLFQGCIRAVRKKLKDIQPEIVHGQGTEGHYGLSAVFSGFPNVITIHGNMRPLAELLKPKPFSYNWIAGRLEDFTLKRTIGVFCNSAYTEQMVKPRTPRTWRVPNAVRKQFLVPPAQPRPARKCLLVNVGAVTPGKRQVELLDVARALRRQGLEFELQFIGQANPNDPYAAAFLEKIRPMEKEGFARYVGLKSERELVELFDASVALVHCSLAESFGLVVAEALARDLKLFAARAGGVSDIADGVPEAELFAVDDWHGLTSAIGGWIRRGSPPVTGAASIMRARYDPLLIARRHVEIYREILGHGPIERASPVIS